jgi:predicted nucleic acid-binding Zn ribbon protein
MPLYQYMCDKCLDFHEITMCLKVKDKVDQGKRWIKCPKCGKKLRGLIAPVRLSSKRATLGN